MKLFFKFFVIASAIALSLNSCQKEFTIEEDPNPTPVDSTDTLRDSIYMDYIVELDSTSATEVDTSVIIRFQYDASKRVISMKQYWDDGGGIALMDEYNYFYNGADTLPAKTIQHMYDYGGGTSYHKDSTTIWYFYASGKVIKDSAIFCATYSGIAPTDTTITTYNFSSSQTTASRVVRSGDRFDPTATDIVLSRDTAVLDGRGNIISSNQYETSDGGLTWDLLYRSVFTYDTKPSPFSRLSNFKTLQMIAPPEAFYYEMQTPNNRTSSRFEASGFTNQIDYSGFIYNSNDQLSSFRYIETGPSPVHLVTKFFYKAL